MKYTNIEFVNPARAEQMAVPKAIRPKGKQIRGNRRHPKSNRRKLKPKMKIRSESNFFALLAKVPH